MKYKTLKRIVSTRIGRKAMHISRGIAPISKERAEQIRNVVYREVARANGRLLHASFEERSRIKSLPDFLLSLTNSFERVSQKQPDLFKQNYDRFALNLAMDSIGLVNGGARAEVRRKFIGIFYDFRQGSDSNYRNVVRKLMDLEQIFGRTRMKMLLEKYVRLAYDFTEIHHNSRVN